MPVLTDSAPINSAPTDSEPTGSLLPDKLLARIHERAPGYDRGDNSLDFILRDAAAEEIYAFAISEAGNDFVLFDSSARAQPLPNGGYAFTGAEIDISLAPAWTRHGPGLAAVYPGIGQGDLALAVESARCRGLRKNGARPRPGSERALKNRGCGCGARAGRPASAARRAGRRPRLRRRSRAAVVSCSRPVVISPGCIGTYSRADCTRAVTTACTRRSQRRCRGRSSSTRRLP